MHIREQVQKLIDRKQQEIRDLELQIEKAKAYIQALQDSMRLSQGIALKEMQFSDQERP